MTPRETIHVPTPPALFQLNGFGVGRVPDVVRALHRRDRNRRGRPCLPRPPAGPDREDRFCPDRASKVGAAELAGLIQAVHWALDGLIRKPVVPEPPGPTPAVAVRRSVRPDAIACLECGARFKILRRHLAADHGLAPEEYRARRGLPADYPMAAPDYAEARSRLAKQAGLGRKRAPRGAAVDASMMAPVAEAEPAPEVAPAPDEGTAPPPAERRGCRKAADPTPE